MTTKLEDGLLLQDRFGGSHWYTYRKCYGILSNREKHPDVASCIAKAVLEDLFGKTAAKHPFIYSPEAFENWLQDDYEKARKESRRAHFLDSGKLPNGTKVNRFSDETVCELLFQRVLQNTNDATFLCRVGTVGTCSQIEAGLMAIKYDESGAGRAEANHCNLFHDLVANKVGYQLLAPGEFHKDGRFIEPAFIGPLLQMAIADYTQNFLPEIVGMAILLEWTGTLDAFTVMKMLERRNIDATFYKAHVIADNPHNGHAYQIKELTKSYLDNVKMAEGDIAEQQTWQRIYQGYYTWKSVLDNFEKSLVNHLVQFEASRGIAA